MEERPPPSDTDADAPIRPLPLPPGHEAYVVQFPLDSVCRVPPPDHARIVEEHTRKTALKLSQPRRRRFHCSLALPIFLIVSVLSLAVLTARSTLYRPLTPSFHVTYIRAYNLTNNLISNSNSSSCSSSNSTRRPPEFRVGIRAGNRNPWLTMNYCGGGAASLEFKDRRIARGRAPATINGNDEGNANFTVCLAGNGTAALPKAVKERLGSESEKYMELAMDLTVEMRSLLRNEELKLQIFCDFKVRNSLAKNAKISWQSCVIGL
ncbi:NDR1/HIN1-like protein 13 [Salvia splendens]|uniref:NDR1/HIN1-like protein 13 n=1 Tax=Salvia splendens TaxID=180675 RepID=UPI001C2622F5|nr:NDR1/HIN1-like protein 13 [Salvia splendens]